MNHEVYIQRCLELTQMGKGHVSPNPMVGAVLVHNGRIIGEGWHQQYGEAHAEVNCLNAVQEVDKALIPESTMYVSLEPCAHHGHTPPCAERLVAEQIKEVVICNRDPFTKVSGKGIQILEDAGIKVTTDVLAGAGRWVNKRFFCYHEQQRPYIILKWAQTEDGFIAPTDSSRFAITNQQSNQLVHKWRTEEDAIMVGYHTALNDNPKLNSRHWQGQNPLRIAIDKQLALPESYHLLDDSIETWILNSRKQERNNNTQYVQLDFDIDIIPQVLSKLYEAKKLSIIIEGGAVLLNHFIQAGLWDEARVFTGSKKLKDGIKAPELINAQHVLQQHISSDELNVYTRKDTDYPYIKGYSL